MISPVPFFSGFPESWQIFCEVQHSMKLIGPFRLNVTKSQVAFVRAKTILLAWIPGRYLGGRLAPLVLTFSFDHPDPSFRWKEIVEPSPGHFTHHLELFARSDVDTEVISWMERAYWLAGD